jgi:hypothetical protein
MLCLLSFHWCGKKENKIQKQKEKKVEKGGGTRRAAKK